jgi:uncharacterized protein Veg
MLVGRSIKECLLPHGFTAKKGRKKENKRRNPVAVQIITSNFIVERQSISSITYYNHM